MQFHELACSLKGFHAVPWACMQFHKLAFSSMSLHAVTWPCIQFLTWPCIQFQKLAACMKCYKLACSFIWLHAVSYACKQFHEFPCSSLKISISLSSSQELRSACSGLDTCLFGEFVETFTDLKDLAINLYMCTLAKLLTLFNVVESFSIIKLQSWNCLRITLLVRKYRDLIPYT